MIKSWKEVTQDDGEESGCGAGPDFSGVVRESLVEDDAPKLRWWG